MKNHPAVRLALLFTGGILIQSIFHLSTMVLFAGAAALFFLAVLLYLLLFFHSALFRNIVPALSIVAAGALALALAEVNIVKYPFALEKIKNTTLYGKIESIDLIHRKEFSVTISCDSIQPLKYKGKIKIKATISDNSLREIDSLFNALSIGQSVKMQGTLSKARGRVNPGGFDYYTYLERHGITALFVCYSASETEITDKNISQPWNWIHDMRKSIAGKIIVLHDDNTAGLLKGLLLGDRSDISEATNQEFINSGVMHVIAVSGLHIVYIMMIFNFVFGRAGPYLKSLLTLAGLVLFMLLSGACASIVRSTLMAAFVISGNLSGRTRNAGNAIALSALVILLYNPFELFDPGFQLSYAAVISIIAFSDPLKKISVLYRQKKGIINNVMLTIAVTIIAQIGTLPFLIFYFNRLSVISLLANIVVIPVSGMIICIGIATVLISYISIPVAVIYAYGNVVLTNLCLIAVRIFSRLPYSFLYIRYFSVQDTLLFFASVAIICFYFGKMKSITAKTLLVVITAVNFSILISLDNKSILPDGRLSVYSADVGQGDATIIKFPDGKTALIDAGNASMEFDSGEKIILPLLNYFSIGKIDWGIVTHLDADHYYGFVSLIKNGRIGRILKPSLDSSSAADMRFEEYLREEKVPYSYFEGVSFQEGGVKLYQLNDGTSGGRAWHKSEAIQEDGPVRLKGNDRSGVIKILYGASSFLFMGDAGMEAENILVSRYGALLQSDVLKAGHHGSRHSTGTEFLKAVRPSIVLISSGYRNRFGHPAPEVLKALRAEGSIILRTDISGGSLLVSDGKITEISDWRK